MSKIRLGIIGVGNMGTGHMRNIKNGLCPEVEVSGIADIDPVRLDAFKAEFGEYPAFASATELLDSGLVEAVIIATPHYFHPPIAIEAMKKGIHVMSEKPAGVYTKQVKEMNAVAKECGVKFGMMFNQRTDHVYRKMRELVNQDGGEAALLRKQAALGRKYLQELRKEVVRLAMLADDGLDGSVLGKAMDRLEEPELLELKRGYEVQAARRFPAAPQLRGKCAEERGDETVFLV